MNPNRPGAPVPRRCLFTSLDKTQALRFIRRIQELETVGALEIVINAQGGSITVALELLHFLESFPDIAVTTYNMEHCDSAAVLLFLAGGRRICRPDASFFLHSLQIPVLRRQTISTLRRELRLLRRQTDLVIAELCRKTALEMLAEAYLQDEKLPLLNLLARPLDVTRPEQDRRRIRPFCGAGGGMIAYDVDGRSYPCHMFSPLVLGESALLLRDLPKRRGSFPEDADCRRCVLRHFCPTCAGFNLKDRGDIRIRDKRKCALHLVEAEVSAKFQIKLLAGKGAPLDHEEAEYADRAMSALSILENLTHTSEHPYF